MRGFTKTGDLYVDSFYGNDSTGDGSKEKPFATIGKAYAESSSNDHLILSGFFEEVVSNLGKTVKLHGDGLCLISGASLVGQIMFAEGVTNEITDIVFFNFQGANLVFNTNDMKKISNCSFFYSNVFFDIYSTPFILRNLFVGCVLNIAGYIGTNYTILNNTFYSCSGSMPHTEKMLIISNHFEGCDSLMMSVPDYRIPGSEIDYNNIVGTLSGLSNDDLQAKGDGNQYQIHGLASSTNQFNVDNSTIDSLTWWKADFTLVSGSDNLNAAKDGKHIGARSRGYRLTADDIWTARNTGTVTNLQYNSTDEVIERTSNSSDGSMETNEIDLGAVITTDLLNVFQQIIDSSASSLSLVGKVDYNADPAPDDDENQKITLDIEIQYGTSSGSLSGWKTIEAGKVITVDGSGYGNAEDDYDEGSATRINFRYFKLRFKLIS